MKILFLSILTLAAVTVPASAITVYTPANGAQVSSPFKLTASTKTCDLKPAVAMGYSIDHGPATVVSTAFTAMVPVTPGNHVLHVKCWGNHVNDEKLIDITVVAATTAPVAATPSFSPAAGQYTSTQSITLSAATPGATIYYTTDGSAPTAASTKYSGAITVSQPAVIEAVAIAPGYINSGLARAQYVIAPPSTGPTIPPNALTVAEVQLQPNWKKVHDPGTTGSSSGEMTLVADPSLSGQAARFDTNFTDWGGELYSKSYANDPDATNFLYDAEVWIEAGSQIGNLEMDNNQVIADGDTVIYAFQCAGDSNTWDYTGNAGTRANGIVDWIHSDQPCNPANWTPNAWHHVQISYSRDDEGNVTYNSVWLDGVEAPINKTVPSAFSLGWAHGDLMTNFQVDGVGSSGSSVLYLDKLTIYRW